jgi:hypothetical protein
MYYDRNSGTYYDPYQQPPQYPWFAVIGIIIVAIWASSTANKTMEEMNAGTPDYIIFDSSKKIVDASGISENDFIEIHSIKEVKQKKKSLKKGEYAFLKYSGFIGRTAKNPFKNVWITSTALGGLFSDAPPNGFVVVEGTFLQALIKPNKIKANIYLTVPKKGFMHIYKMEKIINNEKKVETKKQEAAKYDPFFENNRLLKILMGYPVLLSFTIILMLISFIFIFFTRNRILMPLFLLHCFSAIAYLAFLLVISQTVTNIHFHRFSKGFFFPQAVVIIVAIACLSTVNKYKKTYYKTQERGE